MRRANLGVFECSDLRNY